MSEQFGHHAPLSDPFASSGAGHAASPYVSDFQYSSHDSQRQSAQQQQLQQHSYGQQHQHQLQNQQQQPLGMDFQNTGSAASQGWQAEVPAAHQTAAST